MNKLHDYVRQQRSQDLSSCDDSSSGCSCAKKPCSGIPGKAVYSFSKKWETDSVDSVRTVELLTRLSKKKTSTETPFTGRKLPVTPSTPTQPPHSSRQRHIPVFSSDKTPVADMQNSCEESLPRGYSAGNIGFPNTKVASAGEAAGKQSASVPKIETRTQTGNESICLSSCQNSLLAKIASNQGSPQRTSQHSTVFSETKASYKNNGPLLEMDSSRMNQTSRDDPTRTKRTQKSTISMPASDAKCNTSYSSVQSSKVLEDPNVKARNTISPSNSNGLPYILYPQPLGSEATSNESNHRLTLPSGDSVMGVNRAALPYGLPVIILPIFPPQCHCHCHCHCQCSYAEQPEATHPSCETSNAKAKDSGSRYGNHAKLGHEAKDLSSGDHSCQNPCVSDIVGAGNIGLMLQSIKDMLERLQPTAAAMK